MLDLDSPRWSDLSHAYGSATNTPELLKQLETLPTSDGQSEPWFSIWSSLAHQGDVYSASFAAVPHVVDALSNDPVAADSSYFQFPAWVEVCRQKQSVPIPDDLKRAYYDALAKLPALIAAAANGEWDESLLCSALSALAAAKGFGSVAEAALELNPHVAAEFMDWFFKR